MAPVLKIDTALGPAKNLDSTDPLLLTSLNGHEGVSVPFIYDLVLMRRTEEFGGGDVPIDKILGTAARIGLRTDDKSDGKPRYVHRLGSFTQFEKIGLSKKQRMLVYKARLVPAVVLWGGGVTFRVFEKMNVVDIIREVLDGIRAQRSDVRFDLSRLRRQEFPELPYCVQFRESSFGFISRLMAQHGISYFFDRENGQDEDVSGVSPGSLPAENDTLVLVGPRDSLAMRFAGKLNAKNVDIQAGDDIDDETTIANFARSYRTSQRNVAIGNYNPISPTKPLRAEKTIAAAYDVTSPKDTVLRREEFPSPVEDEDRFVKEYAEETMRQEELDVFSVSGMVKNPNFVAGRTFQVDHDETQGKFDQREFLITVVKISAFENSYMSSTGQDVGDFLLGLGESVLNAAIFNLGSSNDRIDATTAMVSGIWSNYVGGQQQTAMAEWLYPNSDESLSPLLPALHGGAGQQWTSLLLSNISGNIKDVINANAGGFTIQFGAVPWDHGLFLRPQVVAPRPLANGPQLATVVGPKGAKKGELFVDHQLGRVRVRFPWHLKVPAAGQGAAGAGEDPFETERMTAWVPVSQAWAGARFGSQFMPRVGDQVLVEFIDGDPERPIVSGRVYHADNRFSNLPFLNDNLAGQQVTPKSLFDATGRSDIALSGIETRSTPKPERGQDRYHLLRFDDRYNDEQLLMRSQGRLDVTAKCCHYETTEGNRHVRVVGGKDADGKTVGGGASFTTVSGECDEHVGDSRYQAIDADSQLTVKGDTQFDLKGDWINVIGGKLSLNAGTIVIEASQKLTLKVGSSTVVLNPCGVYLDGPMIYHQSGGPADSAADAQIKDVADAIKADPGEPAYMRTQMAGGCGGGGGGGGGGSGGGGRGQRNVPAQHAPPCTLDSEQMICLPLAQLCTESDG
jgi:uncharacterized protein involved in type VI secretion and phage assembly